MRRSLLLLLALVTSLLTTTALVSPVASAAPGFTVTYRTVPGEGGTPLGAYVVEPTGRGAGPFPLLVMPSSWSLPNIEYVGAAAKLAHESGYVVVSYTSRGFHDSGGAIDVAGPETVADVSRVIDWAVANARGDATEVGVAGISYGAGQALLAAAADPRVDAVAALSTWTDLARSLYPNETVNEQAVELLLAAGHLTGRPGPVLRDAEAAYREGRFADVLPISPPRSAASKVDAINASGTAVLLGNAWNDGLFAPGQITDFYTRLTGPKRLMLSPGDHATAELFGAAGLPDEIWESVGRWFDHHLRGVANGVDRENPVQLKPNNGGTWRGFPTWAAATRTRETLPLTGTTRIGAGRATLADSGTLLVSGALQGFLRIPTGVSLPLVDRTAAAVWTGPVRPTATTVSGTPRAHLTVTPGRADTTLFAHLYEVGPLGLGALVTHQPITLRGAQPGVARTVDVDLNPVVWDVAAGNRLALVVDTVDARYDEESALGSTVTFSSPAHDPSRLEIPLG
ncbi:CocE/NonD family hydrolase [Umezawaea beigongshangensis]|uniref:CocE/NonD family hydrolase n=1 Tax=Umezawaea beigongshangensis TaxID=2780383 RepID=UPI0018F10A2A|nr:CocE/NonD family hydrolase [Umezawaea beigongshangensis]